MSKIKKYSTKVADFKIEVGDVLLCQHYQYYTILVLDIVEAGDYLEWPDRTFHAVYLETGRKGYITDRDFLDGEIQIICRKESA